LRRPDLELVTSLRESGDLEGAGSLLAGVLAETPDDADANYQMAWLCDLQDREREAVPYYVRAIAGDLSGRDRAAALLGLGSTYRALGEYPEAVDTLRRGVAEFPEDRALQTFLAMALYNAEEYRESIELLLRNLVETTSDPEIKSYERALTYYADRLDEVWP
jgi:tetratricopeptide (TPR) repeat protein